MSKEELKKLKEKVEDLQEELEELTDEELEQVVGGMWGLGLVKAHSVTELKDARVVPGGTMTVLTTETLTDED